MGKPIVVYEPRCENRLFAYEKKISCAVTAQLISAFVFATQIVQSLYFLNPKFQASSHLLWLCSPVCVGPGRNPEDRLSHNEAHIAQIEKQAITMQSLIILTNFIIL